MFTPLLFWFFSNSFIMMVTSMISLFFLFFFEGIFIFQFDINSFIELPMSVTLLIDKQSLIFISTVSMVSSMILVYSFFYLEEESSISLGKFLLIMIIFIISMIVLSVSANIFGMMIGWDGLGISSFCLIIFYQNWKSFSSGMVTFLSNRFGDVLIIMCIIWIIMNESPNSWALSVKSATLCLIFGMGVYSKSAQFPYLFWLPQAMAAPTPVSALVHSSTLVTAGIYSVCRFNEILDKSFWTYMFLLMVSLVTMTMAGTSSLMEFDLKKIIALSTLCHISLMMAFSVIGDLNMSLFHMSTHALFKSLLFMIAGCIIHYNINSQDIRDVKMSIKELKISFPFFMSIASMIGFPFMSGYYSKEGMLGDLPFSMPSLMVMLMFMINSMFSCAYSFRLISFIFFSKLKFKVYSSGKDMFMSVLMMSTLLSSFVGGMMIQFMVPEENEVIQIPMLKLMLLCFSILGIVLGLKSDALIFFLRKEIISMIHELWKSNFLYKVFQTYFFKSSYLYMWKFDEKGPMKFLFFQIFKKFINLTLTFTEVTIKEPFSLMKVFHVMFISAAMVIF